MNTSDMPTLGARRQARRQPYRRGGRQGDRRRAQGLPAVYAEVHPRTLPARNVTALQTTDVFSPPMNTSDMPPLDARRQARRQLYRRGGRQGDRRRAQGLSAVYAGVRCYPKSTLGLYASHPDDTLIPHARSLSNNALCGIDRRGRGTYTAEGITALCEGLKGSAVASLT